MCSKISESSFYAIELEKLIQVKEHFKKDSRSLELTKKDCMSLHDLFTSVLIGSKTTAQAHEEYVVQKFGGIALSEIPTHIYRELNITQKRFFEDKGIVDTVGQDLLDKIAAKSASLKVVSALHRKVDLMQHDLTKEFPSLAENLDEAYRFASTLLSLARGLKRHCELAQPRYYLYPQKTSLEWGGNI